MLPEQCRWAISKGSFISRAKTRPARSACSEQGTEISLIDAREENTGVITNWRARGVVTIGLAAALLGVAEASPASAAPMGKVRTGKATFYTDGGIGACGKPVNPADQRIVAVSPKWWTTANPNNDPICDLKVRVTYNGKSITVPVRDKCFGCAPNHIDLGRPAFAQLASPSKGVITGVKWKFVR